MSWLLGACVLLAGFISFTTITLLKPFLMRSALSHPNARSSHTVPTPQGGGLGVIAAVLTVFAGIFFTFAKLVVLPLGLSVILLAVIGFLDDMKPLPVLLRLGTQGLAVGLAAFLTFVTGPRLLPWLEPRWIELVLVVLAMVWFVNLTNFMDGLDWMMVAEGVPIGGALVVAAAAGYAPVEVGLIGALVLGSLIGFAPFNRPVAQMFLGDCGSLVLGLLIATALYRLAQTSGLVPALLLPLYFLSDATLTLGLRLQRGEAVWQAHRSHFYQRATQNHWSVKEILSHVFCLNLVLAGFAALALVWPFWPVQGGALLLGFLAVGSVLKRFATSQKA